MESRPLSGKANNNGVRFPDRLQSNNVLPFHATSEKNCTNHGWQLEPIGKKLPLECFWKIYLCNSNGSFIPSVLLLLLFFYSTLQKKVNFNQLIMIHFLTFKRFV